MNHRVPDKPLRPIVYLSGPITKGNRNDNLHQFNEAHRRTIDLGFAPINPGITMLLPFAWQEEYPHSTWIDCDLPLVAASHIVLRLPGESVGADMEVDFALNLDMPVVHDLDELAKWKERHDAQLALDTERL